MAEDFDRSAAASRHEAIIREAQRIRDGLSEDVINYYYNAPDSAESEGDKRAGIKKYLRIAAERIDELLRRLE